MNARRSGRTDRSDRGFSLPELLTVLALMGLFIIFGGPAMSEGYRAYKVRAAADNLTTDIRALRYNAVTNHGSRTMTINNQTNATVPNTYSFVNSAGNTVTITMDAGINIETGSATTLTMNSNGSTGSAGNATVSVSGMINDSRNDRYTITITPTGTVSSAYSTF